MKTTDLPIIVSERFNNTHEAVWHAITDVNQMKQWFFDTIPDFHPSVGFETQFEVRSEDRVFTHLWKVTEVIPLQTISYDWKYKEYPGDSQVTFTLSTNGNQVGLELSMHIREDFPSEIPEFKRESCVGGWNYFINQRLKNYLESYD